MACLWPPRPSQGWRGPPPPGTVGGSGVGLHLLADLLHDAQRPAQQFAVLHLLADLLRAPENVRVRAPPSPSPAPGPGNGSVAGCLIPPGWASQRCSRRPSLPLCPRPRPPPQVWRRGPGLLGILEFGRLEDPAFTPDTVNVVEKLCQPAGGPSSRGPFLQPMPPSCF